MPGSPARAASQTARSPRNRAATAGRWRRPCASRPGWRSSSTGKRSGCSGPWNQRRGLSTAFNTKTSARPPERPFRANVIERQACGRRSMPAVFEIPAANARRYTGSHRPPETAMPARQEQFVLALDQGTTSARAILFDRRGDIRGLAQREITQHYPQPGWVEHDAGEIWQAQLAVARAVLHDHGVAAAQVVAVGITNQRETTVLWDRASGEPLSRAIV